MDGSAAQGGLFEQAALQLPDAELTYQPGWLDRATADDWLQRLVEQTPWQQPEVVLFGRQLPVPRLVAWYGDSEARYRYSGMTHQPLPWTPLLAEIRQRLVDSLGQPLNGVLLNYYRDGQDSMGWHSDDERELGAEPLVASLSLGGERRFDLRRKGGTRIEHSLQLAHGSLLVMGGQTQHHWQHQVAKTRKPCAPRLNLTFRLIRTPL
ncbi:alkylated DNA repair dioxygenase AlkB [Pseudomonas sp. URMO17WK12:I1]|uniref:alpha-ketoglutarate-dependent dioxygenase AlkB family protein n=1 Tax=unclassified Pseudomonas TaxID=196821 RepID=UPI0004B8F8AD|nr:MULTISPECIES: alpha-ketoglutarate-dependent dioxygenase AlkB [unclassified Pseudomonas]PZW64610.1 alkylated DNA repair dioxygenase AlkB [Pseudomonas sp. URMO17WK12:I1]